MIHHLLIPLDGTTMAESVLGPAAFLAERWNAHVTLLHVLEREAPESVHGSRHLRSAEEAETYLRGLAEGAFPSGVRVSWHVHAREVRDVAHSLVDHADEYEPDLVVMCSHGEARLRDWIQGSVPQQVVSRGVIPVLMLHYSPEKPMPSPIRNILVPLDGDEIHEQGLPPALDLAAVYGAKVHLITVVPTTGTLSGPLALTGSFLPGSTRAMLDLEVESAREYLEGVGQTLRSKGLEVTERVLRGDPVENIALTADEVKADLIALGTHGKAGTKAFWAGSLAQRLLRKLGDASFLLTPVGNPSVPRTRPPEG